MANKAVVASIGIVYILICGLGIWFVADKLELIPRFEDFSFGSLGEDGISGLTIGRDMCSLPDNFKYHIGIKGNLNEYQEAWIERDGKDIDIMMINLNDPEMIYSYRYDGNIMTTGSLAVKRNTFCMIGNTSINVTSENITVGEIKLFFKSEIVGNISKDCILMQNGDWEVNIFEDFESIAYPQCYSESDILNMNIDMIDAFDYINYTDVVLNSRR
ncbi:hypothetical protein H6503_05825 [Candidatus Woesearchaeota archaeon]|nr:hypothetical protein [Candidatus Woesearchaeota archaeon]